MASPSDPPTDRAGDTEQFPVTRVSTDAATDTDDVPSTGGPAHAVTAGTPGISRAGWWAITIAAAVLLILGFLLTFGPARYWTPVPVVFLGYFLLSGLIGLVFWKGVRELRDSNPTLHSGDGPATPGTRVAAAIGAVGVASALVLLPAGLSDAPANAAAPCPDGSNTCGPQPTMGPQPTQGNGGNTTAPQAPNTTVPGYTPPDTPPQQGSGSTPTVQGQVPTMPTGDSPSNGCILNCGPTQAPQTGQATPPQTGQQPNPVTTAPNTPATTPQAPTTTPQLRTPTPETTTSKTSSKAHDRDDDQQRSSDEDRDKNSPYPYQAAMLSAVGGTYRRKKSADAVHDGQSVAENVTRLLVDRPVQFPSDSFFMSGPGIGHNRWADKPSSDYTSPGGTQRILDGGNGAGQIQRLDGKGTTTLHADGGALFTANSGAHLVIDSAGQVSSDGDVVSTSEAGQRTVKEAVNLLGTPYAWGGGHGAKPGATHGVPDPGGDGDRFGDTRITGYDCSGFARQAVFAATGQDVMPEGGGTYEEIASPLLKAVPLAGKGGLANAKPGDLLFYGPPGSDNPNHHVAIYMGNGVIAEAPQSGEVAQLALASTHGDLFAIRTLK